MNILLLHLPLANFAFYTNIHLHFIILNITVNNKILFSKSNDAPKGILYILNTARLCYFEIFCPRIKRSFLWIFPNVRYANRRCLECCATTAAVTADTHTPFRIHSKVYEKSFVFFAPKPHKLANTRWVFVFSKKDVHMKI